MIMGPRICCFKIVKRTHGNARAGFTTTNCISSGAGDITNHRESRVAQCVTSVNESCARLAMNTEKLVSPRVNTVVKGY